VGPFPTEEGEIERFPHPIFHSKYQPLSAQRGHDDLPFLPRSCFKIPIEWIVYPLMFIHSSSAPWKIFFNNGVYPGFPP
jgi:hypothetical protein